jgi:toxin-antitoxin system PIN domain toxin
VSRPALLDVNVIVALFDPNHIHHDPAHVWFADHRSSGWATCPITENGVVRVLSNPAYSSVAERRQEVARRLAAFRASGQHVFWPDDVSVCDTKLFGLTVGYRQLTDVYLLGLATAHDGRLATFDRSVPLKAVRRASSDNLVIIKA